MEGWEDSDAVPPPRDGTAWVLRQVLSALQDVLAHTPIVFGGGGEEIVCVLYTCVNCKPQALVERDSNNTTQQDQPPFCH